MEAYNHNRITISVLMRMLKLRYSTCLKQWQLDIIYSLLTCQYKPWSMESLIQFVQTTHRPMFTNSFGSCHLSSRISYPVVFSNFAVEMCLIDARHENTIYEWLYHWYWLCDHWYWLCDHWYWLIWMQCLSSVDRLVVWDTALHSASIYLYQTPTDLQLHVLVITYFMLAKTEVTIGNRN